jgi:TolA-binding protein
MSRVLNFGLAVLVSGCGAVTVSKDVETLQRSVADLRAMQSEQADTISSLDSQVKTLSGRLEEMEFSQNKRLGSDLSGLKDEISSLRRRVPPPAAVPVAELEADEAWGANLPAESAQIFADALALLREGKYQDSIPLLQSVVEQAGPKASTPLFWQGVAYDGLEDNRGALRAYSEVVSRYPKSNRAPSSLYRQALVFSRLGDKKTSALSLRKLVDDYPKSPEASMAKDKLKELK